MDQKFKKDPPKAGAMEPASADGSAKQQKAVPQAKPSAHPATKVKNPVAAAKKSQQTDDHKAEEPSGSSETAKQSDDNNPLTDDPDSTYSNSITVGNLPKGIEENDLRELFQPSRIKKVALYCSKDPYYPSSCAVFEVASKADGKAILSHHHDLYRGKRVLIMHSFQRGLEFAPEKTLLLKNLPPNVNEEGIVNEVQQIFGPDSVEDVIKPTHHYAYFDFKGEQLAYKVINRLRGALMRFKIDVFQVYAKVPKTCLNLRSHDQRPIEDVRNQCGARLPDDARPSQDDKEDFGVHNAHKLFVGNIPRDTLAVDIIDYFNNFGTVIDYSPVEKKSCYLRKSAILSFMNLKHAQNAFCQQPHYLEGSKLNVHIMDCPPFSFPENDVKLMTIKFHSPFLTDDEIRNRISSAVTVVSDMRFDAFDDRANYVARYKVTQKKYPAFEALFDTQYINDEAVKFFHGYDPTPATDKEACENRFITGSGYRQQKEKYLSYINYNENLKEDMEMRTKPSKEADLPFKAFYNDYSIQINNVSMDTNLDNIRDLFLKCGDIVDYRALLLEEDNTKICFVKFKIDLSADLACTYNQRMFNGKRLLVHLARETLVAERERSVLLERLNPLSTTEDIHGAFSEIGIVKYVQKQSPFTAIVCFKDKDTMLEAVNVTSIPKSGQFIVNPCYEEYDPRLFNNFCCQEEHISYEQMRNSLRPRILPEFHQLELERQVFEFLPEEIKSHLINEIFLAREKIPGFNMRPKHQQINILKTQYQDFSQKEHFLRLTPREQEKLLDITSKLQQEYPYEEVRDQDVLPPSSKQSRMEETAPRKPDKAFAANWYSSASQEPAPMPIPPPQQSMEPLNANHVAQALPTSGLLGFPGQNLPPMGFPPQNQMFPAGGFGPGPGFQNMCPPNRPPLFQGGDGILGAPPMLGARQMGGMPGPSMGAGPGVWVQQRRAAMAYNAGPSPPIPGPGPYPPGPGPMGFQRPPYFN
ncbi:hypothetical protein RP20_CCG020323 [Aedes albopictus]|nr:hypothetical protein RP20_CCG020323 [Aedes albopictus]